MIVKAKNIKGFYQIDNTILQFDPIKDVLKLQFNHMIMQKENLSRLTTEAKPVPIIFPICLKI